MADYIPQTDAEFHVWQINLIDILSDNATAWGIPEEVITSLKATQTRCGRQPMTKQVTNKTVPWPM